MKPLFVIIDPARISLEELFQAKVSKDFRGVPVLRMRPGSPGPPLHVVGLNEQQSFDDVTWFIKEHAVTEGEFESPVDPGEVTEQTE